MERNFNLKAYNTFGITAYAEKYLRLHSIEQLQQLNLSIAPDLVLGGGSNLLLMEHIKGLTLHVDLKGIVQLSATGEACSLKEHYTQDEYSIIRAYAGVNWHQFVLHTLSKGLHGLENLALIPGTVGAAPVQNIGAYGSEVSNYIKGVQVWEYGKGLNYLSSEDCNFGYRDSLFKKHLNKYLIIAVDFKLGGIFAPNVSYGAIQERIAMRFEQQKVVSPQMIARAVIEIRAEKLPFYSQLGNSGSFFKNPIVPNAYFEQLKAKYQNIPAYPMPDGEHTKIPAGWLIDQAGWKGKRNATVGTYHKQALVIVNHGKATGAEILAFSHAIQADIKSRYGIELEREVRLVG